MGLIKNNRLYLLLSGILLVATLTGGCEGSFTPKPGNNPDAAIPDSAAPAAIVFRPTIQDDIENASCAPPGGCHGTGAGDYTVIPDPQGTEWEDNYNATLAEVNLNDALNSPFIVAGSGEGGHITTSLGETARARWIQWIEAGAPYEQSGD